MTAGAFRSAVQKLFLYIERNDFKSMDCLFCEIAKGNIPSTKVYEDETVLAFKDINPMAPVHILVIPKEHIADSAADITPENSATVAHIFEIIAKIAKEQELDNGFRVITNSGEDGAQTINHIHFHILGGKKLPEKMA